MFFVTTMMTVYEYNKIYMYSKSGGIYKCSPESDKISLRKANTCTVLVEEPQEPLECR